MNNQDIKKGNKLPYYYDDPLDLFYKKYIDIINPYFKQLGFTPNGITTISFFFGLLACYFFYKQLYLLSGISYMISYFFDTMDGYYARIYNMKSKFGSYYDFISDQIVTITLIYLVLYNFYFSKIKINIKIFIIIFVLILICINIYHMSCQEKYTKITNEENVSEGLSFLDMFKCKNYKIMFYTRFSGPGVLNIVFSIIIILHIFLMKTKK
jgi:phosphatidylglycerophosphate synthase